VKSKTGGDYIGWFSQYDIVTYVLRLFSSTIGGQIEWSSYLGDLKTMEHKGKKFGKTPIVTIMETKPKSFRVAESTMPLAEVLGEFVTKAEQRLAVGFNNMLVDVVTPMDAITFVADVGLGTLGDCKIGEIGVGTKGINKITWTSPAIQAFYLMWYLNVPSIAVVDEKGSLVTTMSASDIKRMGTMNLAQLLQPLNSFTAKLGGQLLPPVTAQWDTPISSIITQLSLFRIHQVFIIDPKNANAVVGVVTIYDICRWLYNTINSSSA